MADLILGPVVDVTVSKVIEVASEQLNLALEWKDDFRRFCFILEMIRGVLLDADEKHIAGHSHLKPWLRELRSVADEADDVLEEIDYENLRRQVAAQKPKWKRFGYFFTPSNPLAFRLRMANRVKNLNIYLADINDWASRLGLQYKLANTGVSEPRGNQQTHSLLGFSDSSKVVGRDEDVDKIVGLLTDSSNPHDLSVISIVGMAGLGKTTLAKKVCAHAKIREYFGENIMWVCVSEIFDVQRILGEMLESLTGSPCINKNGDTLLRKIGEELEKKEEKKGDTQLRKMGEELEKKEEKEEGKNGDTRLRNIGEELEKKEEKKEGKKELKKGDSLLRKIGEELGKREEKKEGKKEGKKELKKGDSLLRKTGEELEKTEEKKEGKKEGKKEEGKNYLLILDDVWNDKSEKWDDLTSCLSVLCKKSGNRVVVTTREKNVALAAGSKYIHPLEPLEPGECWSIIKQRAFGEDVEPPKLKKIGMDIAKKCGGLPLVANVVGGILCNKRDEKEWSSVKKKINVWGSLEDQHRRIRDVLQLSFERLPKPALKQCFAFCSIFPKGSVIEKEKLIQLWMAEGYLQSSKESSMEDVGEEYFTYLLSSSLFQKEARESFENVQSCKIHDLIHDFAQSINYFETLIIEKEPCSNIPHHVRHLNLNVDKEKVQIKLEDVAEKLQTLFSRKGFPSSLQVNFTRLRVLSVCDVNDTDPLPSCFGNLKSLRYLDISGTSIRQLPKFIPKMYNLQTFRFTNCKSLKMPPTGIGHLMNLRHIYFDDEDRMPAHIGRLTSLQTLRKFFVGEKRGYKFEELGKLSQLRGRLEIYNLERVKDKSEAQSAKLFNKVLDELQLIWEEEGNHDRDEDILEGLQTPSNLQILGIQCYGGEKLPLWMFEGHSESFSLKNLVELNIEKCQKLKSIPLLKGFSSLRRLLIKECSELSRIDDGAFAFTSLEELFICLCCKLESVPVSGLTSLQTLEIVQCKLVSSIGNSLSTSKYLKRLLISCSNLESVPSLDGLTSLKRLGIAQCDELNHLPSGLSSCTALEELSIWGCKNLEFTCSNLESVPSLGGLTSLKRLEIAHCDELKHLPSGLSSCTALEELSLWGCKNLGSTCSNLESVPSLDGLTSLKRLEIVQCDDLKHLPSGLSSCTALEELSILGCKNLESIPEELKELHSLLELHISRCGQLMSFPKESFGYLDHLKSLSIGGFSEAMEELLNLSVINASLEELTLVDWKTSEMLQHIQHLTALRELTIFGSFKEFEAPSHGLEKLSSLTKLCISSCQDLTSLPGGLNKLLRLTALEFSFCNSLNALPEELKELSQLKKLEISDCDNLISLPRDLKELHSLVELQISQCSKLRSFPEEILGCLTSLKRLEIGGFSDELEEFPGLSSIHEGLKLEELELDGWDKLTQLPPQIQRLTALKELRIWFFEQVIALPEWVKKFTSLQCLEICYCNNMKQLPPVEVIRGLSKLQVLDIYNCPKLKERCARKRGSEWSKISHIPEVILRAD